MTKELCKTKAEVGMAGNGEPVTHLRHANLFGTLCQLNSGGQICPQAVRYFLLFFFFLLITLVPVILQGPAVLVILW